MRQVCGPLDVRPCGHHLLHQPDPQRLGRAVLLGGEQEAIALPQPSCAGARKVAPPNGMMPRPISNWRNRTSSAAITMSAASASSIDKVNAMPLTAITAGLGTGSRQTPNG